jgi:hypothetical protein
MEVWDSHNKVQLENLKGRHQLGDLCLSSRILRVKYGVRSCPETGGPGQGSLVVSFMDIVINLELP